jgi:3-oxoacyl-[acyl-carrier protein] reductase
LPVVDQHPSGRRIALVTGVGRRQGIGAATCRALAAGGVDIFFTYWRPYDRTMPWGGDDRGPRALRDELRSLGVRCESAELNLAHRTAPRRLFDAATARLGPVSILVNNATYSTHDGWERLDAATLDAHYAVNLRAMALLCVEFARRFQGESGGRIINLTSGQSLGPMPDELAYAATKAAIEAFTLSLAPGLAEQHITVNAVDPGPTDTGWMTENLKREVLRASPQGRLGTPEDAGRLVAFLASDAASWITGQVIHSDGGFRHS